MRAARESDRSAERPVDRVRVRVRIDTPNEAEYYRHGGILQYVLRQLRDKRYVRREAPCSQR